MRETTGDAQLATAHKACHAMSSRLVRTLVNHADIVGNGDRISGRQHDQPWRRYATRVTQVTVCVEVIFNKRLLCCSRRAPLVSCRGTTSSWSREKKAGWIFPAGASFLFI